MSDAAIKAALAKAAKRFCVCDGECFETRHGITHGPCEQMVKQTADVIAAFLRALPEAVIHYRDTTKPAGGFAAMPLVTGVELAAAVERAASTGEHPNGD